jgi:hypothetical protein
MIIYMCASRSIHIVEPKPTSATSSPANSPNKSIYDEYNTTEKFPNKSPQKASIILSDTSASVAISSTRTISVAEKYVELSKDDHDVPLAKAGMNKLGQVPFMHAHRIASQEFLNIAFVLLLFYFIL